jgi:hypothetical protein
MHRATDNRASRASHGDLDAAHHELAGRRADRLARAQVLNVPHCGTISTRPASAMRRSALATLARLTPYSPASAAMAGSASPLAHSPAWTRARRLASTLADGGTRSRGGTS